jgi:DNA polymerase I-like protein with 3'-5' exonuclease and polymerase domains
VFSLTLEQAAAVVRAAMGRTGGALTVDIENTGYPVGHQHYALRTVQLGDEVAAVVFDPADTAQTALVTQLLDEARWLHAHSATADLVPLVRIGAIELEPAWDRMLDTVIPAKLADPQSTGSDPGLKKLGPAVLGPRSVSSAADAARATLFKTAGWLTDTKVDTPLEKSGWAQVDPRCETMIRYAASDVIDTAALARRLPTIPEPILARERLAQRMTARVTHHGVALDYQHVQIKLAEHAPARAAAGARVRELGAGQIENPGSDKQIAQAALQLGAQLPTTDAGNPSVAKDVLEPLKHDQGQLGEFVRAVLDYRHHDTVIGTFLEPYRLLCERGDGRARPTVYTLGTDTGRMSCVRPNLQQLPRQGGVRACITADPGQLMIGADFSGVELRVAAALSGDPNLRQILADGRDIHEEIALQVWGADPELSAAAGKPKPLKEHRYVAKRMVFGRIYGGGAPTLAAQTGTPVATANSVIETLDAMTPGLTAWSESIRQAVKAGHTQFPSYSGRVIHLPAAFPHKGPNYCIQGTARELLIDAFVRWADTRWGLAVLLPVHDELDAFVPAEEAHDATAELIRCMETELYGIQIVADPSEPAFAWADSS